jgi:hypothetical protein
MKHYYRSQLTPETVLAAADAFFPPIGMRQTGAASRSRTFEGVVGTPEEVVTLTLTVKMEGGHYTFVEAQTTAQGESRLDRNVKKFFVQLRRQEDPRHAPLAAY